MKNEVVESQKKAEQEEVLAARGVEFAKSFNRKYKTLQKQETTLIDIVRKVVFDDSAIESGTLYTEYKMRDGDTLESIARRVYGKEELSWVLMIFNRYIDPFYSPSLSTVAFDNYMNEKYDGQTLFVSAAGSSLPYNVDGAGITTGTLIMKKVTLHWWIVKT